MGDSDMGEKRVAVVVMGEEIVSGFSQDKNFIYVAQKLYPLGYRVYCQFVGDDETEIKSALENAERFADVIICSGGLGSTKDDKTRFVASEYFGVPLKEDQKAIEEIFQRYKRRTGKEVFPDVLRLQGTFPVGAEPIPNHVGSAFGFKMRKHKKLFYFLPGVPAEFSFMFDGFVHKEILDLYEVKKKGERIFKIFGVTETYVEREIENMGIPPSVRVSYLPRFPEVIIKLFGEEESLYSFALKVKERLKDYIYAEDERKTLSEVLGEILKSKKMTLAVAESLTGGELMNFITDVPGASEYFKGGEIVYSNEAKIKLGVKKETIENFGVVSHECAKELSESVRERFGTDIGISTTGVAGPEPLEGKSPGLFYIGVSFEDETESYEFRFNIGRKNVKILASFLAMKILKDKLKNTTDSGKL